MVATSTIVLGQTNPNPVTQTQFNTKVSQLNNYLTQNDQANADIVWGDIVSLMTVELTYIKSELKDAIANQNATLQTQFSTLADQQATYYSESMTLCTSMQANQTALINKLGQFAANL